MILLELLDNVSPWEWVRGAANEEEGTIAVATFNIRGRAYFATFTHNWGDLPATAEHVDPDAVVAVEFGTSGETHHDRFGVAGYGNSATVMSTVVAIIADFFQRNRQYQYMWFSADEPSRRSLYRAIINRLKLQIVDENSGMFLVKV